MCLYRLYQNTGIIEIEIHDINLSAHVLTSLFNMSSSLLNARDKIPIAVSS